MNKKGMVLENIVFIVLNIVFVVVMILYISNNMNGRPVYEQMYAKKLAFMIDEANPGTKIFVDMSEAFKLALKEKKEVIKLSNKRVNVNLGRSGGYNYPYFSSLNIEYSIQGEYLVIEFKR